MVPENDWKIGSEADSEVNPETDSEVDSKMDSEAENLEYQVKYSKTSKGLNQKGKLTQTVTLGYPAEGGSGNVSQGFGERYICQVIVKQGEKILCRSDAIGIRAEKQVIKQVRIGQGIDIFSEFSISKWIEGGKIKIGDEVVFNLEVADGYDNYKYEAEKGTLIFLKVGTYEISIVGDGYEGKSIRYEVMTPLGRVFYSLRECLNEKR